QLLTVRPHDRGDLLLTLLGELTLALALTAALALRRAALVVGLLLAGGVPGHRDRVTGLAGAVDVGGDGDPGVLGGSQVGLLDVALDGALEVEEVAGDGQHAQEGDHTDGRGQRPQRTSPSTTAPA